MFAPLHIKTRFSPLGSLLTPGEVVTALQERRIPACAIRDDETLHGAYAVRRAARGTGIRVVIGVDLPVSFEIREGVRFRAVIGFLAEGGSGEKALNRLVRTFWERKERGIHSLTLPDLQANRRSLRFVLSGTDGPVLACLRKGRLADAWKAATALYGAVGNRIVLETGRTGVPGEELTEPFYREMASRYELAVVASSPTRYLRREDAELLQAVRSLSPEERVDYGHCPFPSPHGMRHRYGNGSPAIHATLDLAKACTETGLEVQRNEAALDQFLGSCLKSINGLYGNEPKWEREEIERRFWREYWRIEEEGQLDLVVSLAGIVERAITASKGQSFQVKFLEGTVLGYLLGWTTIDPVRGNLFPVAAGDRKGEGIVIEGNRAFLRTVRSLLTSSNRDAYGPMLEPQLLSNEDRRILVDQLTSAGKGTGHDPKKRSTHSLFEPHNRTNHSPVPSERMQSLLEPSFVTSFVLEKNRFVFMESEEFGWTEQSVSSVTLRASHVHEALFLTGGNRHEEINSSIPRDPEWMKLLAGTHAVPEQAENTLLNASDWILMTENSDSARETLALIARVRGGEIPPPLVGSRIDDILSETEGIPVYREQFVDVIRALTDYPVERAEQLLGKLQNDDPRMLARERHDFIAAVVLQGASSLYGDRVFSFLLTMAEQAIPRARSEETALLMRRVMSCAARNRDRFWLRLINGLQRNEGAGLRKVKRQWMALSARDGVRWEPVSINESRAECEILEPGVIRQGLAGIPGLSRQEVMAILHERRVRGSFRSATDFLDRMLGSAISRPVLIRLARSLQDDGFRIERRGVRSSTKVRSDRAVDKAGQVSLPFLDAVS